MNLPRFMIERKNGQIRLIFPVPQQYEVRTYPITKRRSYSRMEPVPTPWATLAISKETAREIGQALKENRIKGEIVFYANDDWWMTIKGMEVTL